METQTPRLIFALLCMVGFFAIGTGAFLEISRQRRQESLVTPRHFRWRMVSASLWLLILLSLAYGTIFEWPTGPKDAEGQMRMGVIIAGSMVLMMLASFILAYDFAMTMKMRQLHRAKHGQDLNEKARREIERIQGQRMGDRPE